MNQSETFITVGIPAYERPDYTREAVESCLHQNYSNFEIVIQDDSPAATLSFLTTLAPDKIRYERNPKALGLARNANLILQKARGAWMLFLANDDRLELGYLEALNRLVQEHPHAALVRTQYDLIDAEGKRIRRDQPIPREENSFEFLSRLFLPFRERPVMSISAVAFQTEIFRRLGGFKNLHRGYHIDRLAWAELAATGSVLSLSDALASVRLHSNQISRTADLDFESAISANAEMNRHLEHLLRGMTPLAKTNQEKEALQQAKRSIKSYYQRHMRRAFDEAMLAQMERNEDRPLRVLTPQNGPGGAPVHVPFFPSRLIYQNLFLLPKRLRSAAMDQFKKYKSKKWIV